MTKAETAKIKKLTQSFQKAFLAGDWDKVASHYTTNAVLNFGKYTMAVLPPGAPGPVKDSGKYLDVRRKGSDGQWLFHVDMFNSDLPSEPAQTA